MRSQATLSIDVDRVNSHTQQPRSWRIAAAFASPEAAAKAEAVITGAAGPVATLEGIIGLVGMTGLDLHACGDTADLLPPGRPLVSVSPAGEVPALFYAK